MKRLLLFIVILIFSLNLNAQNLIQNGDFEEFRKQSSLFPLSHLKHWYNGSLASPDYQNSKYKWGGNFLKANSGDAYIGLVLGSNYDYSEYATNKLSETLMKDTLYCLSMYVCLSNQSTITPFGVDARFSKSNEEHFIQSILQIEVLVFQR